MSRFTGPLKIEEIEPGQRWRLLDPIHYEIGHEGSGRWLVVPEGTETDGATIPALLRTVLAVWGTYGRAAVLHDYLYSILRSGRLFGAESVSGFDTIHPAFEANLASWSDFNRADFKWSRRWADQEFYTAMLACGTSKPLAFLIWSAVRIGGAKAARRRE